LGVCVALTSLLLAKAEAVWWKAALPSVSAYALLMAGIVIKDQNNVLASVVTRALNFARKQVWVSILAALALTGLAVFLGLRLYADAAQPDGLLRVAVYEQANIEGNRRPGLSVRMESLSGGDALDLTTNDRGLVEFPANLGDVITVSITRDDGRVRVLLSNDRVDENDLQNVLNVDLAEADVSWLTPQEARELGDKIGSLRIDPALLRWDRDTASRQIGNSTLLQRFAGLGLPSAEYIIAREPFVIGYSPTLRQPRWIASAVSGEPVGRRTHDRFAPDPAIPAEAQASPQDYARNIFDRAHLVSRADLGPVFSVTDERNYMTMVTPQTDVVNQRIWNDLEKYTSALKDSSNEVLVIRGPAFITSPEKSSTISINVIGVSRIPVPTHFFQIVALRDAGGVRLECHLVPNTLTANGYEAGQAAETFRASLEAVRAATGLNIFPTMGAGAGCATPTPS
jgi:DNA/RNA endonuclease G (NUC1)